MGYGDELGSSSKHSECSSCNDGYLTAGDGVGTRGRAVEDSGRDRDPGLGTRSFNSNLLLYRSGVFEERTGLTPRTTRQRRGTKRGNSRD